MGLFVKSIAPLTLCLLIPWAFRCSLHVVLSFAGFAFLCPTERRATTGFAIRFGREHMRLPLRIPNASSLVDSTFYFRDSP